MHNKSVRIIIFFSLLLMGAFLALVGRCFYLQYFKGEHYIDVCIKQQRSFYPRKPQRGVILDRRGRVLAASNRIAILFAEPRLIKDPKTTSNKLAPIVDMGAHEICKLITESKNPGFVKIKADADENQASTASKIYGVGVQYDWQRHYPMGHLAAHAIGFISLDNRGLGGIEFQYDTELNGSPGQSIFFADVYRRPIQPIGHASCVVRDVSNAIPNPALERSEGTQYAIREARDGVGIILTLDATIQEFARAELIKQHESYEAESALAIVAEPRSGAILALVSLPDFDPSTPPSAGRGAGRLAPAPAAGAASATGAEANAWTADPGNFRNRALTDQFEPGSIIKPIIAAIALDADVVNKYEKIFCENGSYVGRGFGRIGEYRRGFGDLTLREILIESSNIGMAKIGQRLGKDKLYKGLKFFGFGKKTGIDLPGEAEGLLRPASQWTGYSVTRIPFGQEISVTAIQLIQAFCILANGGHLVQPYLVKAMVDTKGQIIKLRRPPPAIGYVVEPEVAKWIISDALTGVVNEGTGNRAKLKDRQVFGKTGTAQIANATGGGYAEDAYIASFVVGAPAENPTVVVLVSIHKPNVKLGKGYTGGVVAAPVAAAILEKTLNYLEKTYR